MLFDFDGTLTRPHAIDFAGIKRAIGCPVTEPILEFIARLSPEQSCEAHKVLEQFEADAAAGAVPNNGAEDLLEHLRSLGMPVGILTRNSRVSVIVALEQFESVGAVDFDVIITRDDVTHNKPHPEGVLLASERLGVAPANMAVIGDYRYDVEAGLAAGALTFFLTNGAPPPADITAHYLIAMLEDFYAYLP